MSRARGDVSNEGTLKFLTYNIDGLNPSALTYRTNTILSYIISEQPDVIHLQEVVADTAPIIIKSLLRNGYTSFHEADRASNLCHYFTLSFARTDKITNPAIRRIPYSGAAKSEQGRDILQLTLNYMSAQWMFINCHLESCGVAFKSPGSATRQAQLREGLELIKKHSSVGPAILAGDLNIRDPEATKVMSDYTTTINDAAMVVEKGRKSNTWYMPAPSKYSARYDRVYSNHGSNLTPVEFKIIGSEDIIEGSGLDANGDLPYNTASDHRGIVVVYRFKTAGGNGISYSTASSAASLKTSNNVVPATTATTTSNDTATGTISASTIASSSNKRSRIPAHADIITLDDSDTDNDTNGAQLASAKRIKADSLQNEAPVNPVATLLNAINTISSTDSSTKASNINQSEEVQLTAQQRRLQAVEKRHKGV